MSSFGGKDDFIEDMVELLGPLPGLWWKKWQGREQFFTKDGKRVHSGKYETATLKNRMSCLRRYGTPSETSAVSKAEAASLKALLSVMLVYKPSERISMPEALNSDHMKNWAAPALVEELGKGLSKQQIPPCTTIDSGGCLPFPITNSDIFS